MNTRNPNYISLLQHTAWLPVSVSVCCMPWWFCIYGSLFFFLSIVFFVWLFCLPLYTCLPPIALSLCFHLHYTVFWYPISLLHLGYHLWYRICRQILNAYHFRYMVRAEVRARVGTLWTLRVMTLLSRQSRLFGLHSTRMPDITVCVTGIDQQKRSKHRSKHTFPFDMILKQTDKTSNHIYVMI